MFEQLFPFRSHRCQRYWKVIGVEPDHVPLPAVSVSPARGVPEIVGLDVFTGAEVRAPCAAPPERSATASTSVSDFHIREVWPLDRLPMQVQTECLRTASGIIPATDARTQEERWDRHWRRSLARSSRRERESW